MRTVVGGRTLEQNGNYNIVPSMLPFSDTDQNGRTTTFYYDLYGRVTKLVHPEGAYSQFVYDNGATASSRGNIVEIDNVSKDGSVTISAYASYDPSCGSPAKCNKPNTTTDARGNTTTYTYDPNSGVTLSVVKPALSSGVHPTTNYSYNQVAASGWVASGQWGQWAPLTLLVNSTICRTQASCGGVADQISTSISYNGSNNAQPTSTTVEGGDGSTPATTAKTYDGFGNVASVTDPMNHTTNYQYDAMRQEIFEVEPDENGDGNHRTTYTHYTPDGLVDQVSLGVSPGGSTGAFQALQTTSTTYDALDRKIQVVVSGGSQQTLTQYNYDANSRLNCAAVRMNPAAFGSEPDACSLGASGSDGPDRITQNGYDPVGHVTSIIQALGTSTQRYYERMTYGADGEKLTDADANGNLTTYIYDGFDRLSITQYPSATAPPAGQLGSSNPNDYEQFWYDNNSNEVSHRLRDGTVLNAGYDNLNERTTDWNSASLAYDNVGHLIQATLSGQQVSIGFDALGRKTSEASALGTYTFGYDATGARTQITWPDGFYLTYSRDPLEKVTAIRENGATSGVGVLASYTYDDLGRRVGVSRGDGVSSSLSYDGLSRLTGLNHAVGAQPQNISFGYNVADQLNQKTTSNPIYDYIPAASASRSYANDGLNRVTQSGPYSISYDGRDNLTSDGINSYGYSATNQLISYSGPTSSASLAYDGLSRLVQTNGSSTGTIQYAYDGAHLLGEYNGSGALLRRYVPGPDGEDDPVVWYEGLGTGDRRWLIDDQQGSVIAVADINGNLEGGAPNTYDEYGVPGSTNLGRFQYTGQLWIPEIGLYHYKARAYSATLGRFMQTDPIGYKSDLDLYAYVGDDPLNKTDPTGNAEECNLYGCYQNQATPEFRQQQQAFATATGHNNAPGLTIIVEAGPSTKGVVNGGAEGGVAFDNTGKSRAVANIAGPTVTAGESGGVHVTVAVANGLIEDQKGAFKTGGGSLGPFGGSVSVGQNDKGQNVVSTSMSVGPGVGGSISAGQTTTIVAPPASPMPSAQQLRCSSGPNSGCDKM